MSQNTILSRNTVLIEFYKGKGRANGRGPRFNDVLKYSDYELERTHDFIQWLFPDRTGGVNRRAPRLTDSEVAMFRKSKKLRKRVVRATLRMLHFYGYIVVPEEMTVKKFRPIKRKEKGRWIGLYSVHNYKRITRMMIFLNRINMQMLSSLVFLSMCHAMHDDLEFRQRVKQSGTLPFWMKTQPYLAPLVDRYDIDSMKLMGETGTSWDSDSADNSDEDSGSGQSDYKEDISFPDSDSDGDEECAAFEGLRYTGNSCYQDSTLLALFAIPNRIITQGILERDMRDISHSNARWISCNEMKKLDYKARTNIQTELNRITDSMRSLRNVKHCTNLRKLIRQCPGPQKFHGTGTQDAGEFLLYIFNLFQLESITRERTKRAMNDLRPNPLDGVIELETVREQATPALTVNAQSLQGIREISLANFLVVVEDAVFDRGNEYKGPDGRRYRRRIEVTRILSASFLVFNVQRVYHEFGRDGDVIEKRNVTSLVPPVHLDVRPKQLSLYAIVVHVANHYTCYIKCENKTIDQWFYFDDMSSKMDRIGSYDRMLKSRPNPRTMGTMYFYS